MPYVPRSRALITVLARARLHSTDEAVFREVPAFGEGACANRALSELDHTCIYMYQNMPNAFLPVGKAFRLPKSIFSEVPVILGIFDHESFTRVNLPFPFWAACAVIQHFAPLQETFDPGEADDSGEPLEVTIVAVGFQATNAGMLAHWDRDEFLPPNDNRSLWTRFWERYGQCDSYFQLLSIARWNAGHLRRVALQFAHPLSDPAIACWDLWPSFHADCGPPRWLTKLNNRVPPEGSAFYSHKLTTISCPYHGEIVVRQYYPPGFEVMNRTTSKHKRDRTNGPPLPLSIPTRTIGCHLPEWLVALDPDKPPPVKLPLAGQAAQPSNTSDTAVQTTLNSLQPSGLEEWVAATAASLIHTYIALLIVESALTLNHHALLIFDSAISTLAGSTLGQRPCVRRDYVTNQTGLRLVT
ncbi:hypothetical protein GSI_02285 [Ganoderma sinense ZZ0214-1]|uniref:Uncharacterized protein n=1 Tax=Ganoderma sinense ZZ0214-1 TaxID=1077348 RepID=A0A2G8SP51_9APHY|nr:hypothetical protein GSI_02285 [Ganoderma sinense ZZ0214-1]